MLLVKDLLLLDLQMELCQGLELVYTSPGLSMVQLMGVPVLSPALPLLNLVSVLSVATQFTELKYLQQCQLGASDEGYWDKHCVGVCPRWMSMEEWPV